MHDADAITASGNSGAGSYQEERKLSKRCFAKILI
jgi:hypothetical protein